MFQLLTWLVCAVGASKTPTVIPTAGTTFFSNCSRLCVYKVRYRVYARTCITLYAYICLSQISITFYIYLPSLSLTRSQSTSRRATPGLRNSLSDTCMLHISSDADCNYGAGGYCKDNHDCQCNYNRYGSAACTCNAINCGDLDRKCLHSKVGICQNCNCACVLCACVSGCGGFEF